MKKGLLILSLLLATVTYAKAQERVSLENGDQTPVLRVFPNPAISFINIDFTDGTPKGYSIVIFNFLGRKMTEKKDVTEHNMFDLTEFTRGAYIFQVIDQSGKIIVSGKFNVSK